MGTAGFARDLVNGYNRVPAPPPKMTAATDFVFVTAFALCRSTLAFAALASARVVVIGVETRGDSARRRLLLGHRRREQITYVRVSPPSVSNRIARIASHRIDSIHRYLSFLRRRRRLHRSHRIASTTTNDAKKQSRTRAKTGSTRISSTRTRSDR